MVPYYLTIAAVFLFSSIAQRVNTRNDVPLKHFRDYNGSAKFFLILTILVLVLISGLRFQVGTDFGGYYKGFGTYGKRLATSLQTLDEPLLPLIVNFVALFSNDGTWILIICALLTIVPSLVATYRETDVFLFATLLYIFVGCWHGSFNGVRQYLAAALVFAGYRYIREKKFWKYLIFVFLGFCAHRSAIIMIVPYFLLNNKISVTNLIVLAIGTYIIAVNLDSAFRFVGLLKEKDFQIDSFAYYTERINILRVIVSIAPVALSLVLHRGWHYGKEDTFYTNALIINAAALMATASSAYLARLSIYTKMVTPLCFAKLIVFEDKRKERLMRALIVTLYAIYWYTEITGSSSLREYQWVL